MRAPVALEADCLAQSLQERLKPPLRERGRNRPTDNQPVDPLPVMPLRFAEPKPNYRPHIFARRPISPPTAPIF